MTPRPLIEIDVLGIPRAQGRPRAFHIAGHTRVHSPKTEWHTLVAYAAMQERERTGQCLSGPTRVMLEFRMPRVSGLPKTREVPHIKTCDVDNLAKTVLDCLQPALLSDDRIVVELLVKKRYALVNESPGCRITLEDALARGKQDG